MKYTLSPNLIRSARLATGLSVAELAELLFVPVGTVHRWEKPAPSVTVCGFPGAVLAALCVRFRVARYMSLRDVGKSTKHALKCPGTSVQKTAAFLDFLCMPRESTRRASSRVADSAGPDAVEGDY